MLPFPFKRFIKGPNLQEETETISFASNNSSKPPKETTEEDGIKAFEAYQEIINEPSTASVHEEQEIKQIKKKKVKSSTPLPLPPKEIPTPPPPLSQLMRICESNKSTELERILNSEYTEILNLDRRDEFGWTLLMCSSCAGSNECVQLLLKAGADWTLRDKKGLSAYFLAEKQGRKEVCKSIEDWCKFISQERNPPPEEDQEPIAIEPSQDMNPNASKNLFCQDCQVHYSNKRRHERSIAHLVSSTPFIREKVHYGIPESNRGFQLMLQDGWDRDTGLGPEGSGNKYPIKTVLKRDRKGVGNSQDRKSARITHFAPFDTDAVAGHRPKSEPNQRTLDKREEQYLRMKEKRKEIHLRRELDFQ